MVTQAYDVMIDITIRLSYYQEVNRILTNKGEPMEKYLMAFLLTFFSWIVLFIFPLILPPWTSGLIYACSFALMYHLFFLRLKHQEKNTNKIQTKKQMNKKWTQNLDSKLEVQRAELKQRLKALK